MAMQWERLGGRAAAEPSQAASIHLRYEDKVGYFAGRSTLNVWCRISARDGSSWEINNFALGRIPGHYDASTQFAGTKTIRLGDGAEEPHAIEVAVSSSDRYGYLTWDSDDGRNYRVARD